MFSNVFTSVYYFIQACTDGSKYSDPKAEEQQELLAAAAAGFLEEATR